MAHPGTGVMKSSSPMREWYASNIIDTLARIIALCVQRCGGEHGTGVDGARSKSSHGIFAVDHLSLA